MQAIVTGIVGFGVYSLTKDVEKENSDIMIGRSARHAQGKLASFSYGSS
jgi:hypothetical protein